MSDASPWTVLRLITWTKDYFVKVRLDEPRLSAEMLLAHVLDCPRMGLYTQFDRMPAEEQLARFRELVKQAAAHEPIAYLVGQREFYSLAIEVNSSVLVPRPETELLVDAALEYGKKAGRSIAVWDVCTGSGCVAVAVAKFNPQARVLATDISEAAVEVARRNAGKHHVDSRVRVETADLLATIPAADEFKPFDVITANPPYVSDAQMAGLNPVVLKEPRMALCAGATGLELTRRIVADAPDRLRPGGLLALEMGQGQADAVYALLTQSGRYESIQLLKDAAGIDRTYVATVR